MNGEPARDELTELRNYVSDLKANMEKHWNRYGSREAHEQEGAVRMAQRILLAIDGRIENARKRGWQSPGEGGCEGSREPVAAGEDPAALVPPAEVVPAAGSR